MKMGRAPRDGGRGKRLKEKETQKELRCVIYVCQLLTVRVIILSHKNALIKIKPNKNKSVTKSLVPISQH